MSRRQRRNAASRRGASEAERIAQRALQVASAKGASWPALHSMAADPVRCINNLAQVVVYQSPWEDFLRLDKDPSQTIRLAVALSHHRDYKGGSSNLGLPAHRFGEKEIGDEWQRRGVEVQQLMLRLTRDRDPGVRAAATRNPWTTSVVPHPHWEGSPSRTN